MTLQQLVDNAGPALADAQAVSSMLNIQSTRAAQRVLQLWRQRLSGKERSLLLDYSTGTVPDSKDPFPEVHISPLFGELEGRLLGDERQISLHTANKKILYKQYIKVINKKNLCNRAPTTWANRMTGNGPDPQWRLLYKPPLKKKTADLQWRILHGAVGSNAFISVFTAAVSSQCPFCPLRETVFHAFSECGRLAVLFTLLTNVFNLFSENFSIGKFIYGAGYNRSNQRKWQLLNFISGEAKLAIYVTRKRRIENNTVQEAATVFCCNIRCCLKLEFGFYKLTKDLNNFRNIWCYKNVLCTLVDDHLTFANFLL
ncbi:PAT complex subunit Asterix isoform X2 [Antennarius striatus]